MFNYFDSNIRLGTFFVRLNDREEEEEEEENDDNDDDGDENEDDEQDDDDGELNENTRARTILIQCQSTFLIHRVKSSIGHADVHLDQSHLVDLVSDHQTLMMFSIIDKHDKREN